MKLNQIAKSLSNETSEESFLETFIKLHKITDSRDMAEAVWQLLGWYWLIGHEQGYNLKHKRDMD